MTALNSMVIKIRANLHRIGARLGIAVALLWVLASGLTDPVDSGGTSSKQPAGASIEGLAEVGADIVPAPTLHQPEFVAVSKATLHADELVLGVSINGDSRAYPVWALNTYEIVNDEVGGVPVLVTW